MALYKDTELSTLQANLPIIKGQFDIKHLLTIADDVELEHIEPLLGSTVYDRINTAHNGAGATGDDIALLAKVQWAEAPLLMMHALDALSINIGNNGITIFSDENTKQAFEWQVEKYRTMLNRTAFNRMDQLLIWLEENKATYTTWAASDAYTTFKEGFINTAVDFTKYFPKLHHSRQLFQQFRPIQLNVEEGEIQAILGKTLYDNIKTEVKANTLTDDHLLLMPMIKRATAFLTVEKALHELQLILEPNAIMLKYISNSGTIKAADNSPQQQISSLATYCHEQGMESTAKLKAYLDMNYETYTAYDYDEDEISDLENTEDDHIFMI